MSKTLQNRLAILERPIAHTDRPLPAIFIRPDEQTAEERSAFDAAVRQHERRGGVALVFAQGDDAALCAAAEVWL